MSRIPKTRLFLLILLHISIVFFGQNVRAEEEESVTEMTMTTAWTTEMQEVTTEMQLPLMSLETMENTTMNTVAPLVKTTISTAKPNSTATAMNSTILPAVEKESRWVQFTRRNNGSRAFREFEKRVDKLRSFAGGLSTPFNLKRPNEVLSPINLKKLQSQVAQDLGVKEDELTEDWDFYEPPKYILDNFPYYIAGYDEERRPIYVAEVGRMDVRGLVERGEEAQTELLKYSMQTSYRLLKAMKEQGQDEIVGILDSEGLELRQLTSFQTLQFLTKLGLMWRDFSIRHTAGLYIINANFFTEQLVHLARPIMGKAMEKLEVYGTRKHKWIPVLRRAIGHHNLAPWYGGSPDFKPVVVYG